MNINSLIKQYEKKEFFREKSTTTKLSPYEIIIADLKTLQKEQREWLDKKFIYGMVHKSEITDAFGLEEE